MREWKHSCFRATRDVREFIFLLCVGDQRGGSGSVICRRLARSQFGFAVRKNFREQFWSGHENESENRGIRNAANSPRALRFFRFLFKAGFRAVFNLTLEHHLDPSSISASFTVRGQLKKAGPAAFLK